MLTFSQLATQPPKQPFFGPFRVGFGPFFWTKESMFPEYLRDEAKCQAFPSSPAAGLIFAVVKSGWTINGRVLRAAQVGDHGAFPPLVLGVVRSQ